MTRKQQLWILVLCSALTAALQYTLQGTLATGGDPGDFSPAFWFVDRALWGVRALIEAMVIIYLFTTTTSSKGITKVFQETTLLVMEGMLLALLGYTLGPIFQALGAKTTVYALMGVSKYATWSYAIGLYTSLMMAGAGIGYKIQPWDLKEKAPGEPEEMRAKITRNYGIPLLTTIIQEHGTVNRSQIAKEYGVSRQTIVNWLGYMEDHQIIAPSGNGNFMVVEEEMEMPFG